MLTYEECNKALNRDIKQYTEEQILAIRDFISELADIYLQTTKQNYNEKESDNLY